MFYFTLKYSLAYTFWSMFLRSLCHSPVTGVYSGLWSAWWPSFFFAWWRTLPPAGSPAGLTGRFQTVGLIEKLVTVPNSPTLTASQYVSLHWFSLISLWFCLHSPYGLTAFHLKGSSTAETSVGCAYLYNLWRSMQGFFFLFFFLIHLNAPWVQACDCLSCTPPAALLLISHDLS